MSDNAVASNLIIIASIIALLIYSLNRLRKSQKPIRQHPQPHPVVHEGGIVDNEYGDDEYDKEDKAFRRKYNRDWFVYFSLFIFPIVLLMISFYSIYNLEIGVPILLIAIIYLSLSEIIIRLFDIGDWSLLIIFPLFIIFKFKH